MKEALEEALGEPVVQAALLAGGASKQTWSIDTASGRALVVRRAAATPLHTTELTLREEFDVLVAARDTGVRVPEPIAYLGEVDGRAAFAMERISGETIGRRIVKDPPPGLDLEMAEQLALVHRIPVAALPTPTGRDLFDALYADLDTAMEPHPAIELGLAWCRERLPLERESTFVHGDFRVGNLAVDADGIVAVLDWEFAHVGDPAEDVAWPLVRAWRFGVDAKRLGGVTGIERYLARYGELTGRELPLDELYAWEVLGNCKWAIGALRQTTRYFVGDDRNVEFAILGRLACEVEYELLDLIARAA